MNKKPEKHTVEHYTKMMYQNKMDISEIERKILEEFREVNAIRDYISKLCEKIMNKKPEKHTVEYYTKMMYQNKMDISEIEEKIKSSSQVKFDHLLEKKNLDVPILVRMQKDWDERAKANAKWFIHSVEDQSNNQFWESGKKACDIMIANKSEIIFKNNFGKNMTVLEIGCGIGRLLVPMSKIFGEVIGIDVSSEMIKLANKEISLIHNCKVFQNNGTNLINILDDSIDFCYSVATFQHIPDKEIIKKYLSEVHRILKKNSCFWFQVNGTSTKTDGSTWNGVSLNKEEIKELAKMNKFKIIDIGGEGKFYFTIIFQK